MGIPVVTVVAGGLPVVESTVGGMPVTEAANGYGMPVTKVVGKPGLPVVFETIGVGGGTYATFDEATVVAVTLSGSNLVATSTGTSSNDQGAKGAVAIQKNSGKYYFEMTFTSYTGTSTRVMAGLGSQATPYTNMSFNGTNGAVVGISGTIHAGGGQNLADIVAGGFTSGAVVGVAADLDNRKCWFRAAPSGLWNNSGTADPATNVGGVNLAVVPMVPFCTFGGTGGVAGTVITANFGGLPFSGLVPAGFTSGWPV